jgi:WD40 repeat protein
MIKIWDYETNACLLTLKGHSGAVTCLTVNTDQTILFSGSMDKTVRVWNISTGECNYVFHGHEQWIKSITWYSGWLIAGGWDDFLMIWCSKTRKLFKKIPVPISPIVYMHADEQKLIVSGKSKGKENQFLMFDFGI